MSVKCSYFSILLTCRPKSILGLVVIVVSCWSVTTRVYGVPILSSSVEGQQHVLSKQFYRSDIAAKG